MILMHNNVTSVLKKIDFVFEQEEDWFCCSKGVNDTVYRTQNF